MGQWTVVEAVGIHSYETGHMDGKRPENELNGIERGIELNVAPRSSKTRHFQRQRQHSFPSIVSPP